MHKQVEQDAREFGAHVKAGGWRLALLVARNVEKGAGNPTRTRRNRGASGKVSQSEFGRVAETSQDRVGRYLVAWEKAAKAKVVPAAATLNPGDEVDLDVEQLPAFGNYYDASHTGGKPSRDTVIREARKLIAEDQEAAHEVMDDPKARMRAASAIHGHRAAAESQIDSEDRAHDTDRDEEYRIGMMLLATGSSARRVVVEAMKFGRDWKRLRERYADLPDEDAWDLAYDTLAEDQARVMAIFDAARGEDLDSVLDRILAESEEAK